MSTLSETDWFAGFADGEGCFRVEHGNNRRVFQILFRLRLRLDDVAILYDLQKEFGGRISYSVPTDTTLGNSPGAKPQAAWKINSKKEVLGLIAYFDEHPMRAKKSNEYPIWREAAILYYRHSAGAHGGQERNPQWLIDVMEEYSFELSRLKEYEEQPIDLGEIVEGPQLILADDPYAPHH